MRKCIAFPNRSVSSVQTKARELGLIKRIKPRPCSVCGGVNHFAKGLCNPCYRKSAFMKKVIKTRWQSEGGKRVQRENYHKHNEKKRRQYRDREFCRRRIEWMIY